MKPGERVFFRYGKESWRRLLPATLVEWVGEDRVKIRSDNGWVGTIPKCRVQKEKEPNDTSW